jgi:hypothetical protein
MEKTQKNIKDRHEERSRANKAKPKKNKTEREPSRTGG